MPVGLSRLSVDGDPLSARAWVEVRAGTHRPPATSRSTLPSASVNFLKDVEKERQTGLGYSFFDADVNPTVRAVLDWCTRNVSLGQWSSDDVLTMVSNMRLPFKAVLLAGIPLVIMTAIGLYLLGQGKTDDGRSTVAAGVIVAALCGASVIYQVERWSLKKQLLIHFIAMAATVLPALLLSGWFQLDSVGGYLLVIGAFLGAGALLFGFFTFVFTVLVPTQRT